MYIEKDMCMYASPAGACSCRDVPLTRFCGRPS